MKTLWLVLPGFFLGLLVADSVRKIFSEDDRLLRRLFADQPVTMAVGATIIGTTLIWVVLEVLGVW